MISYFLIILDITLSENSTLLIVDSSDASESSSPVIAITNSAKLITPSESVSTSLMTRSTWDGGRSAKFILSRP